MMKDIQMIKRSLLLEIADLLLKSDEATADWAEVKILRRIWYLMCGLTMTLFALMYSGQSIFRGYLQNSPEHTNAYRIALLIMYILLEGSVITLTIHYYKYAMGEGVKIKLMNVLYFYSLSIILFGCIYMYIWLISPDLFNYNHPAVPHSFLPISDYFSLFKLRNDFLIFSGMHSVNGSFYNLSFNSIYPAIIGWIQSVYTLGLLALLIASYVNQKTNVSR
jgi:hypothetical protein